MPTDSEARNAWHSFCDELKRAGDVVFRDGTPGDELTRAEGLRHLVRMIRAGFESSCEFGDPQHPAIVPMVTPTLLYEGVTPDARYYHAFIDGDATYRLRGQRGTAPFIEFSVYTGQTGLHPTHELVSSLTEVDLQVEDEGHYELVLAPTEQPGNWLRTGPDAKRLFLRQYAPDWAAAESATFEIERAGGDATAPPLRLDRVLQGLEQTAAFVSTAPAFWAGISEYWRSHAINQIVPQEAADARTDITVPTGHRFACGYFELAPGEALEIRFAPAEVPFWNLGLASYWYEPLHWPETRSSVNSATAQREADGSVRVVLAERAPEHGNWLDLAGHREGTMIFRWSRTNEALPTFETRVLSSGAGT